MTTEIRDLAAFRRVYDLPTARDYARLLASPDHERIGRQLSAREHAGVARMRAAGFSGSTLAEAYQWWLGHAGAASAVGVGDDGVACADSLSAAGCGGACHCH